ncbi:MAG TPA: hypothetical protein VGW57_13710 [Chthoniobacterales bacterium]|nr:hypothetical protein [Chthoniobacterales bacterium]
MNIRFVTAIGDGFEVGNFVLLRDNAAMVSVGASIEREEPLASEESVELRVRVADARQQTVKQIESAAIERAVAIIEAARSSLAQKHRSRSSD